MSNLFNPLDPTFQFCLQTVASVLFVKADEATQTIALRLPSFGNIVQLRHGSDVLCWSCSLRARHVRRSGCHPQADNGRASRSELVSLEHCGDPRHDGRSLWRPRMDGTNE